MIHYQLSCSAHSGGIESFECSYGFAYASKGILAGLKAKGRDVDEIPGEDEKEDRNEDKSEGTDEGKEWDEDAHVIRSGPDIDMFIPGIRSLLARDPKSIMKGKRTTLASITPGSDEWELLAELMDIIRKEGFEAVSYTCEECGRPCPFGFCPPGGRSRTRLPSGLPARCAKCKDALLRRGRHSDPLNPRDAINPLRFFRWALATNYGNFRETYGGDDLTSLIADEPLVAILCEDDECGSPAYWAAVGDALWKTVLTNEQKDTIRTRFAAWKLVIVITDGKGALAKTEA